MRCPLLARLPTAGLDLFRSFQEAIEILQAAESGHLSNSSPHPKERFEGVLTAWGNRD
jgi:hypothetical protein